MAAIVTLHIGCYWLVTRTTAARGPQVLVDTTTQLDRLVPHLPGTWPLYWIAYPFVLLGAGAALIRLSEVAFRRAALALAAMTVTGAVIQMILPAQAPWPEVPALMQERYHASALVLPYATLPSMHVAYCTFAAGLLTATVRSRLLLAASVVVVTLVAVSTLTLKEHVVLDAVTGLALAFATLAWWQRGMR
jgi:membrane-associated phospholipid phosphatase